MAAVLGCCVSKSKGSSKGHEVQSWEEWGALRHFEEVTLQGWLMDEMQASGEGDSRLPSPLSNTHPCREGS